jgi:DNA-binding transcriptional regulator YdaS (Cro superfamily)
MSNAILKAADLLGGQASLARAMGVQPPTVNQWAKGDRPIPAERCPQIEALTAGGVRCEELRPDVNWAVLRKPARKAKPTQAA